ncbi:protein adenylyltransferase SelO [Thalassotalea castellviae]|uniref:Protein nucleotidyltransferase YdiU n=1 Tax=Thalassotalea castellviae TaxID=3075612 RepID=A0ABU2ZZP3_9GAMM|nr:YdiU family protein [Thalassotalea sp. W431]MDT0603400.1 YdiU family protein [Thalassotalea sp. W431]
MCNIFVAMMNQAFNFQINNQFTLQLPADTQQQVFPRQVEGAAFSYVLPQKTQQPSLVSLNEPLALALGFTTKDLSNNEIAEVLTGNKIIDGMQPYAMNYGGHQFGQWAGQLGDGRAINLGQIQTDNSGLQTLQLKGAGKTPYSRHADGLAVLRSSIREYLCSEAMFHLGIPTTRALSLCLTGDKVTRDMFYDGNPQEELGAVVCRVSSSFMRFGSFQLPAMRGDKTLLKQMVDFSIKQNFPHLGEPCSKVYIKWYQEISERTCQLIVDWMRVGFVHGVMNTDNMSIIGETIDYGPYGWIDAFDLTWTPNTTDAQGKRYSFGRQPEIGQWNLFQLGNAIYTLIDDAEPLNKILNDYAVKYQRLWLEMMQAKLGLDKLIEESDAPLFNRLEKLMMSIDVDMTLFYRALSSLPQHAHLWQAHFLDCFYQDEPLVEHYFEPFSLWLSDYQQRLTLNSSTQQERQQAMNSVNPKFVLRNYLAQQAIEKAEQGDYSMIEELLQVLQRPYDEQKSYEQYAVKRPTWAKNKAGCSMLSCSS